MIVRGRSRFVLRTLLLYGNAFAYGAGAYAGLLGLPMSGKAGEVLLIGASSFLVACDLRVLNLHVLHGVSEGGSFFGLRWGHLRSRSVVDSAP